MSSRAVPGSAATPCVDQLVLSTQKAAPQDACAAPAAARSATPPEHAIANRLFIPFPPEISSRAPAVWSPGARKPYGRSRTLWSDETQEEKGGARGGAVGSKAVTRSGAS